MQAVAGGAVMMEDYEKEIVEETCKKSVRAVNAAGRDLGLTEEQIKALGESIKKSCKKYEAEISEAQINRRGNYHWTRGEREVLRKTIYAIRDRIQIDLSQAGAGHELSCIARCSIQNAWSAIYEAGRYRKPEEKTERQLTYERRAQVIDITPRFQNYLSR